MKKEMKNIETNENMEKSIKSTISVEELKPLQESKGLLWKIALAVVIVVVAFFVFKNGIGYGGTTGGTVLIDNQLADQISQLAETDYVLGDANAPVTIIEFSDFECPYCGRYSTQTFKMIEERYINTGKVKYIFRDFPLSFHQAAMPAAIAANAAGEQGKYYEYHDKLFANQNQLNSANYRKWAQELGLDLNQWEASLNDPKMIEEIQKDLQGGISAGVQGTPAFFINGELISGAQSFSVFQEKIEAALNQ